ncbi:hypothetical protein [Streptomyces sp. NPDC056672]
MRIRTTRSTVCDTYNQALHRAIGVEAAVLTAWLATRRGGRK